MWRGAPPAWIVPPATDREPNLSFGYIVSFIRLHERGFTAPASRFMWGLCYHYGVELHNFAPNAISQAATFVGIREGLGDPRELGPLDPLVPSGAAHRRHERDMSASGGAHRRPDVRCARFTQGAVSHVHIDEQQLRVGEGVVLPSQRRRRPPPYTGKVLKAKTDAWHHGVSPSSCQERLESLTSVLKSLADAGLGRPRSSPTFITGGSSPSWRGSFASSR
jgi:hypothetical protein